MFRVVKPIRIAGGLIAGGSMLRIDRDKHLGRSMWILVMVSDHAGRELKPSPMPILRAATRPTIMRMLAEYTRDERE